MFFRTCPKKFAVVRPNTESVPIRTSLEFRNFGFRLAPLAKTHSRRSMGYASLLQHCLCAAIKARFVQADLKFMRSVFVDRLDWGHLVSMFSVHVPSRRCRQTGLFNVPFGRVDTVKNGWTVRVPRLVNDFLCKYPGEDFFPQAHHKHPCIFMQSWHI